VLELGQDAYRGDNKAHRPGKIELRAACPTTTSKLAPARPPGHCVAAILTYPDQPLGLGGTVPAA
jgi:hypothetical protein